MNNNELKTLLRHQIDTIVIPDSDAYVYILINPKNNQIFYVGKGQFDRMYQHELNYDTNDYKRHNLKKCEMIESIIKDGNHVRTEKILTLKNNTKALKFEALLCQILINSKLYNVKLLQTILKNHGYTGDEYTKNCNMLEKSLLKLKIHYQTEK